MTASFVWVRSDERWRRSSVSKYLLPWCPMLMKAKKKKKEKNKQTNKNWILKYWKNGLEVWWRGSYPQSLAWIHAAVYEKPGLRTTDGQRTPAPVALLTKSSRAKNIFPLTTMSNSNNISFRVFFFQSNFLDLTYFFCCRGHLRKQWLNNKHKIAVPFENSIFSFFLFFLEKCTEWRKMIPYIKCTPCMFYWYRRVGSGIFSSFCSVMTPFAANWNLLFTYMVQWWTWMFEKNLEMLNSDPHPNQLFLGDYHKHPTKLCPRSCRNVEGGGG